MYISVAILFFFFIVAGILQQYSLKYLDENYKKNHTGRMMFGTIPLHKFSSKGKQLRIWSMIYLFGGFIIAAITSTL